MGKHLKKILSLTITFVLILQLVGCGTILYPERRGQRGGRIDPGVAILDAVGLLFFIIPGVIAFAVDFGNGAIYLPGTHRGSLDADHIKYVKFDPSEGSMEDIERIVKKETGCDVALDGNGVTVAKLKSTDDMMARFAHVLSEK